MRVLLVGTGLYPVPPEKGGGAEAHTYYLTKSLARLGIDVSYITDLSDHCFLPDTVTIKKISGPWLNPNSSFFMKVIKTVANGLKLSHIARKELIDYDYDVVHVHDVRGNLPGLLIDNARGDTPLVFTMHGPTPFMVKYRSSLEQRFREVIYGGFDLRLLRRANYLVTVANPLKDELIRLGIPRERISVIPNGVDTEIFTRSAGKEDVAKETYGIENDYCIFVGQLVPRKGVDLLISAFENIRTEMGCIIVGEGSEYQRLYKLIDSLDLQDRVKLVGAVPLKDLVRLYTSASFFVLPSVAEGLPLVVLEAMSCGLPVVASDVGGLSDVVIDKYNGFLVGSNDVGQLRSLIELLGNDSKLRKTMSNNAYEFIRKNFSWDLVAEKYLKIYNMLS